jgi:hypothetical protein
MESEPALRTAHLQPLQQPLTPLFSLAILESLSPTPFDAPRARRPQTRRRPLALYNLEWLLGKK